MAVKQLSDNGPDGTTLGQSVTDLVAFYGGTPVAQSSLTTLATGATIATVVSAVQAIITNLRASRLAG